MQSTKNGADGNAAMGSYCARERRILVQRQVRSTLIVILLVRTQQTAQMPFAKNNNMVEALPSDRADQRLRICGLNRVLRNRGLPDIDTDFDHSPWMRGAPQRWGNRPASLWMSET